MLSATATRVFASGEDSFALPLTSELDALCGENVNRIPCASHCGNPIQSASSDSKGKKNGIPNGIPKASASCRDFSATPHPSHSHLLSPAQVFGSADSLLVGERCFRSPGVSTRRKKQHSVVFSWLQIRTSSAGRGADSNPRVSDSKGKEKRYPGWDTESLGFVPRL